VPEKVEIAYQDQKQWVRKAILNIANMGKFSSDRTIMQYAGEIWDARPMDNQEQDRVLQATSLEN
jgi:starch phosphorylase